MSFQVLKTQLKTCIPGWYKGSSYSPLGELLEFLSSSGVLGEKIVAKCKYCQKEITWMKEGRKNVPVEGDGGLHRCEYMLSARDSLKSIAPTTLSPEEIAKYEQGMNHNVMVKEKKKKK